jgi:dissimilatory sulfite reductase (desulfoviridin) alpha/beta subunit
MAREAGAIHIHKQPKEFALVGNDLIKAFEALVRADEREACAKVCENDAWRCKKIAVETQDKKANAAALEAYLCAEAIRARGNI